MRSTTAPTSLKVALPMDRRGKATTLLVRTCPSSEVVAIVPAVSPAKTSAIASLTIVGAPVSRIIGTVRLSSPKVTSMTMAPATSR